MENAESAVIPPLHKQKNKKPVWKKFNVFFVDKRSRNLCEESEMFSEWAGEGENFKQNVKCPLHGQQNENPLWRM